MTVANLVSVMTLVKAGNRRQVWEAVPLPPARLHTAEIVYSSHEDQLAYLADYYVNCYPFAHWIGVTQSLHPMGETDALKKAQTFLLARNCHKGINNVLLDYMLYDSTPIIIHCLIVHTVYTTVIQLTLCTVFLNSMILRSHFFCGEYHSCAL